MERQLEEGVKFSMSGMIDHVHGQSAFGISIEIQL